jgi:peroxiredoxin (alkyl hydroperoxide reductase subunit C)
MHNLNFLPSIGEKFPEMEVLTTHGKIKLPGDFKRHWLVLFCHPADFTPVSTTELISIATKYEEFQKLECEIINLSIDQIFSHIEWVEWIKDKFEVKIPFPIIADNGYLATKLGLVHPEKSTIKARALFIIDPEGIIRLSNFSPLDLGRNVNEIIRIVKALKAIYEEDIEIPADWPNNELLGSQVIIPAPTDEEKALQRPSEFRCYDWWFCYKSLEYD